MIELLVAMSLSLVVIGATTSAFVSFNTNERINRRQNDAQDQARQTVERVSRQLRNLASPLDRTPRAIDHAQPFDLVFQTIDNVDPPAGSQNSRNVMRVRYCLSPTGTDGTEKLYRQQMKWTVATPPAFNPAWVSSCPNGSWNTQMVVAENVVSRTEGNQIFSYTPSNADLTAIKAIQPELYVDVTPGSKSPPATRLASGVFLRNQNRAPVANCSAVVSGASSQIVLNGSGSSDPEGRNIVSYAWFRNMADATAGTPNTLAIASGVVGRWTAPGPGSYALVLRVTDVGGLTGFSTCNTVTVT